MYTLSCKDLGMEDCHFVAKADDKQKVIDDIIAHADEVHAEKMEDMRASMSQEEIEAMMGSKIKQEA